MITENEAYIHVCGHHLTGYPSEEIIEDKDAFLRFVEDNTWEEHEDLFPSEVIDLIEEEFYSLMELLEREREGK